MTESQRLLADYARNGSETAFRELVGRYVNLVYSTALRLVAGDTHLAQDVTQVVFVHLARKAARLGPDTMLGGWLHQDTCYVAAKTLRRERRRRTREQQAVLMQATPDHSAANLEQIAPLLDEAINRLGNEDRTAILLRFFEQCDFRSIGVTLGSNEDAARMRVNRALEKLDSLLRHRGVALSAVALGTLLSAEAVSAVPVGLGATVSATALAGSATSVTATLLKIMAITKLKAGIIGAVVVAVVAIPIVLQQQRQSCKKDELLRSQSDQLAQLSAENRRLANQAVPASNGLADDQMNELLRLRGQVGLLRGQTNDLARLRDENRRLQEAQVKTGQNIAPLDNMSTSESQRRAATAKATDAHHYFSGFMMYADEHEGEFPTNWNQVETYLAKFSPTTETNSFELTYRGSLRALTNPGEIIVIREWNAWPTYDGKWARTYGFADGHSEVRTEPYDNFDDYEKQHTMLPSAANQPGQ